MQAPEDRPIDPTTGMPAEEEDFAAMFAASEATSATPEPGETIRGVIVKIGDGVAFVDIGAKSEGIIELADLCSEGDGAEPALGQEVEAYVVANSPEVRLSRTLARTQAQREELRVAYEHRIPVQAHVVSRNKGGFEVRVGGMRGFMPVSQVDLQRSDNPDEHVGKSYRVRISEFSPDGRNIVVSRAVLLREEAAERAHETRKRLVPDAVFEGEVRRVTDYGAFVDIGGIDGLVHVSELRYGHVSRAADVVKPGDKVRVRVLKLEPERDRISLSMRMPEEDPWKTAVGTQFKEGGNYEGTVQRLEDYGAFVELAPGLEGLLHVSELTWDRRVRHPRDVLSPGQKVTVQLLAIDLMRQRLSLGMKQLSADPWQRVADAYPVGSVVRGVVESIAQFGVFVTLEAGVTGLVPTSESGTERGTDLRRAFAVGQPVECAVLAIEPDRRRCTLTIKGLQTQAERREVDAFLASQQPPSETPRADRRPSGGLGTLGDVLRAKLDKTRPRP